MDERDGHRKAFAQYSGRRKLVLCACLALAACCLSPMLLRISSGLRLRYFIDHAELRRAAVAEMDGLPRGQVVELRRGDTRFHALPAPLQIGRAISIDSDSCTVVFGGGFGHWGLVVTREEALAPGLGSLESVAPGVWFFSE